MTQHLPSNVMIRIALKTPTRDQEPHTDILPKEIFEDIVTEWVNKLFYRLSRFKH
jgi:hypothetical protein